MTGKKINVLLGSISISHEIWIPYSVGCLISFVQKNSVVCERFNFLPVIYQHKPIKHYKDIFLKTDILGLTCYVWNQDYCRKLARYFKILNPLGTVLFGGPNVPEDEDAFNEYIKKCPEVDMCFCGPGEKNFLEFLLKFKCSEQINPLFSDKKFIGFKSYNQIESSELPNPYSENVFDHIFCSEIKVKCSFETTRGCPFSCSFCDWGGTSQSKVLKFDIDQVEKVLNFIYSKKNITELEILDANFGMLPRDIQTIDLMIKLKRQYQSSPKISYSGLVKNGSQYLPEILKKIYDLLGVEKRHLKLSFQTHTPEALVLANRQNIKNQKIFDIINNLKIKNVELSSEMIIGLPGESASSWLDTIQKDYDFGISYMRTYILNVVCNTQLANKKYLEKYQIKTKTVAFPYLFSQLSYRSVWENQTYQFSDQEDFEETKIIHECFSYDLSELSKMFDYWWFYQTFYNGGTLKLFIKDCQDLYSVRLRDLILHFFKKVDQTCLLKNLLKENREWIYEVFRPTARTEIVDIKTYWFFSRSLRRDEIFKIWKSQSQFIDELTQIFCDFVPEASKFLEVQSRQFIPYDDRSLAWKDVARFFGTNASLI